MCVCLCYMMCIFINSAGEARLSRSRLLHVIVLCSCSLNAPALLYKADHDAYTKKKMRIQKNVTRGAYTKKTLLGARVQKNACCSVYPNKVNSGCVYKKNLKFQKI